jgi:phosphoglycerate kinase
MKTLSNLNKESLYNKKILLRADLDVPLEGGVIKDTTRLKAWFPTLELLLKNQAHVFIAGHLGRPEGVDEKLSLKIVALWIKKELELHNELEIVNFDGFKAFKITGNLFLLENLRFHKKEEEGNEDFSKKLASLAQIYINDAFASSHRAHSSIVGVTKYMPSFAGLRLEKEVEVLSQILENPKRPLCVIIGGAKIETKLPLVEKMHGFADYVLVGGEIAENDKVLLKVQHEKIEGKKSALLVADLTKNSKDITKKSAENFVQIAKNANTIVWNGPMGLIEEKENQIGTNILAEGIVRIVADTVVGGGDTVSFVKEKNLLDKFTFVSTGGGAMLEFLAGVKLPGIAALA